MSRDPTYRTAIVTARIAPGAPGEVSVNFTVANGHGLTDTYLAISRETLEVGTEVVVLHRAGGKTVVVAANA